MSNLELNLDLDRDAWDTAVLEDDSEQRDDRLHYMGGITICGVLFHVTAIRVKDDENGEQVQDGTDGWAAEDLEAIDKMTAAYDCGNGFSTVKIGDYEYVLHILPSTR
jgi:hypothetical protein